MTRFSCTKESAEDILKLVVDARKEGEHVYRYRNLMAELKGLRGVMSN
jgi:hypothetical protein